MTRILLRNITTKILNLFLYLKLFYGCKSRAIANIVNSFILFFMN